MLETRYGCPNLTWQIICFQAYQIMIYRLVSSIDLLNLTRNCWENLVEWLNQLVCDFGVVYLTSYSKNHVVYGESRTLAIQTTQNQFRRSILLGKEGKKEQPSITTHQILKNFHLVNWAAGKIRKKQPLPPQILSIMELGPRRKIKQGNRTLTNHNHQLGCQHIGVCPLVFKTKYLLFTGISSKKKEKKN